MVGLKRRRWVLAGVILTLFLGTVRPGAAQSEVTISFFLPQTELQVDELVRTELRINNASQLVNVLVILEYTPTFMEVADANSNEEGVQIEAGAFLTPGQPIVIDNVVDELFGEIVYEVELVQPVSGSGVLVAFDLIGAEIGEGYVRSLLVELETADGRLLYPEAVEIGLLVTDSQVALSPTATAAAGTTTNTPTPAAAGGSPASPTPVGGGGAGTSTLTATPAEVGVGAASVTPTLAPSSPEMTPAGGYPPGGGESRPGPTLPPTLTSPPPEATLPQQVGIVPLATATPAVPAGPPAAGGVTINPLATPVPPAQAGQAIGALAPAEEAQGPAVTASPAERSPNPTLLLAFLGSLLLFMLAGGYATWRILRATYEV